MNIVLASSKIHKILLPSGRTLRPQVHCLVHGQIGIGKSSIITEVGMVEHKVPSVAMTKAAFLGTIDKLTGEVILPSVWEARNSVLLIDEFVFNKDNPSSVDFMATLLQIMENPCYIKKVGFRSNDTVIKCGDLKLEISKGNISVKTRFSLLATTMFNPAKAQSVMLRAFVSRCIVLPYDPTMDDILAKLNGTEIYVYQKIPTKQIVKISQADHEYIVEYLKTQEVDISLMLRTYGDIVRCFAVLGKHDLLLYERIIAYKKLYEGNFND